MQCDLTKIQTIINLCTCIVNFHVEEILVGCWFRRVVLHKLLPKSLNLPEVARMIYINFLLTTRFFLVTPLDSMGFQSTAMDFTGWFSSWLNCFYLWLHFMTRLPPMNTGIYSEGYWTWIKCVYIQLRPKETFQNIHFSSCHPQEFRGKGKFWMHP